MSPLSLASPLSPRRLKRLPLARKQALCTQGPASPDLPRFDHTPESPLRVGGVSLTPKRFR